MYDKLQCGKCHGTDGRGTGAVATTFEDDWRQPLRARDLTEPWTFHGGATSRDIYLRFRTGMSGTPMPSFADAASDAEMWDLANYVVSLARKPVWSMNAEEVAAFYARQDAEAKANPVKRGEYLVETLGCALCHSPVDEQQADASRACGSPAACGCASSRSATIPTGNLTSDKETGLGNWTRRRDQAGDHEGDSARRDAAAAVSDGLAVVFDDEARGPRAPSSPTCARCRRCRTRCRRRASTFLPLYLWGKFKLLILGGDPPIVIFAGNAGSDREAGDEEGSSNGRSSWSLVVAVCGFLAFLYFIPPFFIDAAGGRSARPMADAAPAVADIADPAERAIAERGRYIVMTHAAASAATRRTARRDRI